MDFGGRGNFREQSPGQVLPADGQGPAAIGGRDQQMGQAGGRDRTDSTASGIGGRIMKRRKRMMEELDQDIREHIAIETQENIERGMSPEEARYAAMRKFGNVTRVKEETREVWSFVWVEQLLQDVRFALRILRKNPGFALTAVLILALGIAANVIVFGVLQALVLRELDVPHADQVMDLQPTDGGPFLSYPEMRDVRDGNSVFSAVAAVEVQEFGLEANGVTRPVWGCEVSGQYCEVVGIKPFLGRLLQRSDDDHPGASEAAVLSWP